MKLPKIIKEKLGEEAYNLISKLNEPSPEAIYTIYTSAENIEAWNKVLKDTFDKIYIGDIDQKRKLRIWGNKAAREMIKKAIREEIKNYKK